MSQDIPKRALGRTGEAVSLVGLGGAHVGNIPSRSQAVSLIREAINSGITFMDNCWDYHAGRSEEWMGEALRGGWRDRTFLMTKIDGRSREPAAGQIEQSLRRLSTDRIDLVQLHEVIRWDDPERVFAPGGAIEALEAARHAGKVRYIGFTGHKNPDMLLKMLKEDFAWDTVQMPLNVLDVHFESFQHKVLPELVERGIGVLAMKPLAAGHLFDIRMVSAIESLQYVMGLPVSTVITGIQSWRDLEQAVDAASTFSGFSAARSRELEERVAPFARRGLFELYKTTHDYDTTYWHPAWLQEPRL